MFSPIYDFECPTLDLQCTGDSVCCVAAVAECEITQRIAYVRSSLDPVTYPDFLNAYHEPHEFSFQVDFISLDGSYEDFLTQDRSIVRSYLNEIAQRYIMPIVLASIPKLLQIKPPPIIYRVAKMPHPSNAALRKHTSVTDRFQAHGYDVHECDRDACQRAYWVMERRRL